MQRALLVVALLSAACSDLPRKPPPLVKMQEPTDLLQEPDDETRRAELPRGSFTGVEVGDARTSLDAQLGEANGVLVTAVVENSPGAAAGIVEGDVLLEVRGRETVALHWPSEWRRIELEAEPGSTLHVVFDRAGAEGDAELVVEPRVRAHGRDAAQRFREEERVGVVVRTATEVEARAAALGPGAGAVVVGLTLESPWRPAGVVYGDLIRAVDGREVAHPQVLLDAIRAAPKKGELKLEILRGGEIVAVDAPLSRREQNVTKFSLQPLWGYKHERDVTRFSILLGLVGWRSTPAAWEVQLLWLFTFAGGDADRLVESVEK
jgi:C-terminal processing protease CtpA/Prc